MYDDKRVIRCLLEGLFVRIVGDRLLSQPLIKGSNDSVLHGVLVQNVIDFGFGCAEQELTFGGIEKR